MVIHFEYEKKQVMSALRHHFISRPEIKILLIIVNLFTILSAILFYMHKIQPLSFLLFSLLWFVSASDFLDYSSTERLQKINTFQDQFSMDFNDNEVVLQTQTGITCLELEGFQQFSGNTFFLSSVFQQPGFFPGSQRCIYRSGITAGNPESAEEKTEAKAKT